MQSSDSHGDSNYKGVSIKRRGDFPQSRIRADRAEGVSIINM